MLYEEDDFKVIYSRESKESAEAIEYLSHSHHRMKVEYAERKEFLMAFIPLLLNKEKKHGLAKVSDLARVLHLTVEFMDADGGTNTLNTKCIEVEIHNLYRKMYPDD